MKEQERQQILSETVRRFKDQQWFRGATVYDKHPITGEPTLEFRVNYVPLLEKKFVKDFMLSYPGLSERYVQIDKNGNQLD